MEFPPYWNLSCKELYESTKHSLLNDKTMDPDTKHIRLQQLDDYYLLFPKNERYKENLLFFIHMYEIKFIYKF